LTVPHCSRGSLVAPFASGGQAPHAIALAFVTVEAECDALAAGLPGGGESAEHDVVMPTNAAIPAVTAVATCRLVWELRGRELRVILMVTLSERGIDRERGAAWPGHKSYERKRIPRFTLQRTFPVARMGDNQQRTMQEKVGSSA
jgi:hypothetical protein